MKTFTNQCEKYFLDPVNGEICLIRPRIRNHDTQQVVLNSNGRASSAETRYTTSCSGKDDYYRLQRKVMFSEASVSHSVHKVGGDLSYGQRLPQN